MSRQVRHGAAGALLLFSLACNASAPAEAGCASDNDCKGDRICVAKACVSPSPSAGAAVAPAPVPPLAEGAAPGGAPAPEAVAGTPGTPAPSGVPALAGAPTPSGSAGAPATRADALATAPSLGANEPAVLVTWFGDLECPYCAQVTPLVRELIQTQGLPDGLVRVEYRHNPLDIHPGAQALAVAAVSAHLQGRFWQFFDGVGQARAENGGARLPDQRIVELAQAAAVDTVAFQLDRVSPDATARVATDRALALALGVKGTPAFFVNGMQLDGPVTRESLRAAVALELKAAGPKGGASVVEARIRANNPALAKTLYDGAPPPTVAPPPLPPPDTTVWKVPVAADDPAEGSADAPVTLVLFGDLECPFTAKLFTTLKTLREQRPDAVRVVFKHNPLAIHPSAGRAALYAVYAASHGAFWPFVEKVFAGQPSLQDADLNVALLDSSVPVDGLDKALAGSALRERVERDQGLAARVDAIGSPNLYVNGRRLVGARGLQELLTLVDEEKAKADALIAAGTPAAALYAHVIEAGQERQPLGGPANEFTLTGAPLGDPAATTTLVLYSDFQCPFSSRLVPILDRVLARFPGRVRLYFKHFPQDFHPEAKAAAREAICAAEQGRFWEVYRGFLNPQQQQTFGVSERAGVLAAAGVEAGALKVCLATGRPDEILARDLAEAERAEVKGTPTLFVNGRRFVSPTGYNDRSLGRLLVQLVGPPVEPTPADSQPPTPDGAGGPEGTGQQPTAP